MKKKSNDKKFESLRSLDGDQACWGQLSYWLERRFNIFDVLGASRMEIRHSNVLAWLLDPSDTHGLGNAFLAGIIRCIIDRNGGKDYHFLENLLSGNCKVFVDREYTSPNTDSKCRIDIRIVCGNNVIIIENKVGAGERETLKSEDGLINGQLKDYVEITNADFPSPEIKKAYLFLTPDGELPEDQDDQEIWGTLSYEDVLVVVENVCKSCAYIEEGPLRLIKDYLETLRRHVVKNEELLHACREVYLRHKAAFDLVKVTMDSERKRILDKSRRIVKDAIRAVQENQKDLGVYLCEPSNGGTNGCCPSFHSSRMDVLLPPLKSATGSWRNQANYFYWFMEVLSDDISTCVGYRLCLEFGGAGLSLDSQEIARMKKLYKAITGNEFVTVKTNGKNRAHHQTWDWDIATERGYDIDTKEGSAALSEWVCNAIKAAMKKELELIQGCFPGNTNGAN